MSQIDLLIAPIFIIVILILAWRVKPWYCDTVIKRYYFPALLFKMAAAIGLGLIYQYYYEGGDTFAYHTFGSRVIWEAFMHDPWKGIRLIFSSGLHQGDLFQYSSRIWYFRDPQSFWVIRVASIFDLFTGGTYSGTAILFSVISFTGSWALFNTFYKRYPEIHLPLALSVFFVPTVIFWSSGILKDTLTFAAIGWAVYAFDKGILRRMSVVKSIVLLMISIFIIYSIKIFILLILIPAFIVWYFGEHLSEVRHKMIKLIVAPVIVSICLGCVAFAIGNITKNNARYALEKLGRTAQVTAYDIRYWTGKDAGSGYSLGELDGSFGSLLKLAPKGLVVSIFRPYLWEVKNPLMLLSSIEGLIMLVWILVLLIRVGLKKIVSSLLRDPTLIFAMIFSIAYSIAVGVSTFNFGTLSRYKVPGIPFLLVGLSIIHFNSNRGKSKGYTEFAE